MKKLTILAAGLLVLPLAAWAGVGHRTPHSVVGAGSAQGVQQGALALPVARGVGDNCCWVWMNGLWWCVPC